MKKKAACGMRQTGEFSYFTASNSRNGFCSYYRERFDREEIGELYAIKGGPGTGKSRFMRDVADCAKERGWKCEMIYCSSDADSLDGIILRKERRAIALLDATFPHVWEPTKPGFRENLINLGDFWDGDALAMRKEEIERLSKEKSNAYRRAYRFLSAYGEVMENRRELIRPYLRISSLERYATGLMSRIENGKIFSVFPALIHSLGMGGMIGLDSYFAQAKRIFLIRDCRGSAEYLMQRLYDLCRVKKLCVFVSRDPILPDVIDGLFLPASGDAFVVGDEKDCIYPHRNLSLNRFVKTSEMRAEREKINYTERLSDAMLTGAIEELETVKKAHFLLEEIYSSAMDFEKKEAYTKAFCERILQ